MELQHLTENFRPFRTGKFQVTFPKESERNHAAQRATERLKSMSQADIERLLSGIVSKLGEELISKKDPDAPPGYTGYKSFFVNFYDAKTKTSGGCAMRVRRHDSSRKPSVYDLMIITFFTGDMKPRISDRDIRKRVTITESLELNEAPRPRSVDGYTKYKIFDVPIQVGPDSYMIQKMEIYSDASETYYVAKGRQMQKIGDSTSLKKFMKDITTRIKKREKQFDKFRRVYKEDVESVNDQYDDWTQNNYGRFVESYGDEAESTMNEIAWKLFGSPAGLSQFIENELEEGILGKIMNSTVKKSRFMETLKLFDRMVAQGAKVTDAARRASSTTDISHKDFIEFLKGIGYIKEAQELEEVKGQTDDVKYDSQGDSEYRKKYKKGYHKKHDLMDTDLDN